ncbi:MAG: hypothetical protein HY362_00435 [Candidatus Aenigmarchaeota archaeon]|nr:hypothetical protein [Candidatus Aenigmarchaeota archaeon]
MGFEERLEVLGEAGAVLLGFGIFTIIMYFLWGISPKIVGGILGVIGVAIMIYFPAATTHQLPSMAKAGIMIGIIMLLIGAAIVLFG